jgi:hypothetical protein
MASLTKRSKSQDRSKVAGGQKHEVSYEAGKTGVSPGEVRQAVKDAGNSRKKVEEQLGKR